MSEIVYSSQKRAFQSGRIYQNPRFFDGRIPPGVTKALVIGDWPRVVEAYEEKGLEVEVFKVGEQLPLVGFDADSDDDAGGNHSPSEPIEIPDHFERLNFRGLRELVSRIKPDADITTKKEAIELIREYQENLADNEDE